MLLVKSNPIYKKYFHASNSFFPSIYIPIEKANGN